VETIRGRRFGRFFGSQYDELVSSIIAVLALAKGKRTLARMALLTDDEREELLGEAGRS
jgi:hypothetical protein